MNRHPPRSPLFPSTTLFRSQIADPEFAAKALAGRDADIRRCLGCNQECVGRVGLNRPLGCVTNPRAGREAPLPVPEDRKSTRLNSSHANISYAVFCLKKKRN